MARLTPLPRVGGFLAIQTRIETKTDDGTVVITVNPELKGTCFGFLLGERPKVSVRGREFLVEDVLPGLREQRIARDGIIGWYVLANDQINLVDNAAAGQPIRADVLEKAAAKVATGIVKPRMPHPGLMRPVIGGPVPDDEVWISKQDAHRLGKRLDIKPSRVDGLVVELLRYPSISPTGCSARICRVVENLPPAICVGFSSFAETHQGDGDGDLGFVFAVKDQLLFSADNRGQRWYPALGPGGSGMKVRDLAAPRKASLSSFAGQLVRGRWIGLLTYFSWELNILASLNSRILGMSPRQAFMSAQECATPLTEGVMDARKDASGADSANRVCDTLQAVMAGKLPIGRLITVLREVMPREKDENGVEYPGQVQRFSEAQLSFFENLLKTAGCKGPDDGPAGEYCNVSKILERHPALKSLLIGSCKPGKVEDFMSYSTWEDAVRLLYPTDIELVGDEIDLGALKSATASPEEELVPFTV